MVNRLEQNSWEEDQFLLCAQMFWKEHTLSSDGPLLSNAPSISFRLKGGGGNRKTWCISSQHLHRSFVIQVCIMCAFFLDSCAGDGGDCNFMWNLAVWEQCKVQSRKAALFTVNMLSGCWRFPDVQWQMFPHVQQRGQSFKYYSHTFSSSPQVSGPWVIIVMWKKPLRVSRDSTMRIQSCEKVFLLFLISMFFTHVSYTKMSVHQNTNTKCSF